MLEQDIEMERMDHPLLKGLNPEQKQAVLHFDGPLLILAGAGSGKTRVITHRIAYLIQERGVSPRQILAITFTNKAAKEMKERVSGLIGEVTSAMWIGTFHAMMARVLRRFAENLGFTRTFAIADTSDQLSQIKAVLKDMNLDEKTFEPRRIQNAISSAKNQLIDPEEYRKEAHGDFWKMKVADVYTRYQSRLKQSNLMDFDDLLFFSVQLFRENKDILAMYQQRFRYIMVDEYQDTNNAQYQLIHLLSQEHKNLCVVGDDDQSIYSFRGADIQNILDFEKDFKTCTVIKLEQNYRSTANILKAANQVIHNNEGRKSKKLWTSSGEGEKITQLSIYDERSEAMFIAGEIQRMVRAGECNYRDIGILYRMNVLSRNIEFALQRSNVPFKIFGGLRFFDRKEIKDTMAYLNLISSPRDNNAFRRAVATPRRGIGETTILEMERIANEHSVSIMEVCVKAEHFPELSRAQNKIKDFVRQIAVMQKTLMANTMTLSEYIEYVQNESGLVQEIIDKQDKGKEDSINRLENLKELLSEAVSFEDEPAQSELWDFTPEELAGLDAGSLEDLENAQKSLAETREKETLLECLLRFLDQAALQSDLDWEETEEENNYVSLMTIHSAKGLEFDVVFVVGMEEGIFPGYRSISDPKAIEEERRLAYVAITRARKKLFLSNSDSRLLFGRTECYIPSRFLAELPEETLLRMGSGSGEKYSRSALDRMESSGRSAGGNRAQAGAEKKTGPIFGFGSSPLDDLRAEQKKAEKAFVPKAGNLRAEDIKKGDRVKHTKFGIGVVVAAEPVAGDAILKIRFENFGEKRLMANAANLAKAGVNK